MVQGIFGNSNIDVKGEWAIVGGTGQFAYAQGVVLYKQLSGLNGIVIRELEMHVLCPIFPKPSPVIKEGAWGGNGGTAYELPGWELPHRLQTVTVHGEGVIDSIAFTYVDEAGTKRSVGPFGGDGGVKNPPIILGPSETLREIYGTTGDYGGYTEVVTSLTVITSSNSVRTYGTQSNGKKTFRIAKDNHNIVGFYGRAGGFVDQIGAYLRPK
ncbi:mannose/glucose-specific lectin-like [Hordeum vulgare]|nr:mannose/glucose-specific lectin-like [Hordeum vulgare]